MSLGVVSSVESLKPEQMNDDEENVKKYSRFDCKYGTTWLAFRDVPALFQKYVRGTNGIDYGCGAGRSTRFLNSMGMNPIGVDVSDKMITSAREVDRSFGFNNKFVKIESGVIPVEDMSCNFVFSSFVLLVISSEDDMINVLKEMNRVLKEDGSVIISTGNENMHDPKRRWVSYETDFRENRDTTSGALNKIRIKDVGAEFYDYNWLHKDYLRFFEKSGFVVSQCIKPLGKKEDNCMWRDESDYSPYYIFVLKKRV